MSSAGALRGKHQSWPLAPGVLLEERNIFIFKLHCLFGTISRTLYRVFPNPKEIIKRNHGKVRCCLLLRGFSRLVCCFNKEFQDVGLDGKLFPSGWVPLLISIQHKLKAREEAFRSRYFFRICSAGQRNCLVNGCKRATYCAILDLVSFAIIARANTCCKSGEKSDSL